MSFPVPNAETIAAFEKGRQLGNTEFTLPLLREVFPKLIAEDLVSVQPMTGPIAKAFPKLYEQAEFIEEFIEFFTEEEFNL